MPCRVELGRRPGDLAVAIDGYLEPVTARFEAAMTKLWQAVRELPIGEYQYGAMHRLLGSGITRDLERLLDGEGAVDWVLDLVGGGRVIVRVWRGDGLTTAQRVGRRYVPEQQLGARRGAGLWAIRDVVTGNLVRDGAGDDCKVLLFSIRESAQAWIARRVNFAGYRGSRHLAGTE
ncbi:hypothetical protein [Kitasatospora sp. NPDC093558]|uniref:hypothetical protein n=1 Tax=Kitasatospora sp. NPDC093558 TaxID=3155201 RepID=UPI00342864EE